MDLQPAPTTRPLCLRARSIWAKPFDDDLRRHIVKYFPSSYHGFDKKGQPIYIDRTGSAEIDKVLEVCIRRGCGPLRWHSVPDRKSVV